MVDVPGSHPRSLRTTYPVRSERLLLRPLAIGDAGTLLAYRGREDVCRYVPFEPMSRDDILAGRELGYVFNPALGGRGYATEAANVMLRLGFEGLGLHRIIARIDERNASSVGRATRLGMRQEARLVRNEFFKGEWSTGLDFAMLADEWYAQQKRIATST
jgi:Acetyltransferase (GNAT) domain